MVRHEPNGSELWELLWITWHRSRGKAIKPKTIPWQLVESFPNYLSICNETTGYTMKYFTKYEINTTGYLVTFMQQVHKSACLHSQHSFLRKQPEIQALAITVLSAENLKGTYMHWRALPNKKDTVAKKGDNHLYRSLWYRLCSTSSPTIRTVLSMPLCITKEVQPKTTTVPPGPKEACNPSLPRSLPCTSPSTAASLQALMHGQDLVLIHGNYRTSRHSM